MHRHNTPERGCWYISIDAVDKDLFGTDAMVKPVP
jgi:hypothetical protein